MAVSRSVSVVLAARVNQFKADMASAGKAAADAAQKTETAWDNSSTGAGKAMQSIGRYRSEIETVGGSLATFGAVVTGALGLTAKAAISWESAWTGVLKTVDGTPQQLSAIEKGLRGLAKELPASHEEIAKVAEAAGQLGVKAPDIVSFTRTMVNLGETTNLTAEEAATNIAQIMNVMGTAGEDVGRFGAALVELGNNGASTEKEILSMAQRLSGAGKLVGATESDVLGLANAMASVGIRAELGGGVMSRVLQRMYADVQENGEGLENLAKVAGVSSEEFAAAFQADPVRAIAMVTEGLNGVKESGGNVVQTMADLGIKGTEETGVMLQMAGAGDLLSDSLDMGAKAWEENSALAEEAAKRYASTESQMRIAGNTIKDTGITIGETFLPVIAEASKAIAGFSEFVGGIPKPMLQTGAAIAGIAGAAALGIGGLMLIVPRIADTVTAYQTLKTAAAESTGAMGRVAGAAEKTSGAIRGIAAAAATATVVVLAFQAVDAAMDKVTSTKIPELEKINAELLDLAQNGTALSGAFGGGNGFTDFIGGSQAVNDMSDALEILNIRTENGTLGLAKFRESITPGKQEIEKATEGIKAYDEGLASLAANGNTEAAQDAFAQIAADAESQGYSVEFAASQFPQYKAALQETANQLGVTKLTDEDYANWMRGELPAAVATAVESNGQHAEGLAGVQGAADGVNNSLKTMLDGLLALGIVQQSEMEALDAFEESVARVDERIGEEGFKKTLDNTTAAGRANRDVLFGIADAGRDAAGAMAENGASQEELRGQLKTTYDDLVAGARAFGADANEANRMAREIMGIPEGVSVDSWMDDAARTEADKTGKKVDEVDKKTANPKVNADTKKANQDLEETKGLMGWLKRNSSVTLKVWSWITETFSKDGQSPTDRSRAGGVKGHMPKVRRYGSIDLHGMASGGLLDIAEVVRPGDMRLVGDATVDEAFIPLDGSQRSIGILMEAIRRMPGFTPMAEGGIVGKSAEAKRADEEERKLARERLQRVRELRAELRQDLRRGSIRDQVTGGLSGGYSAIDRLAGLGSEDALGRGSRSRASSSARRFESNLRSLYAQAERIDEKLKAAKDKAEELEGIKNSVASGFMRERDLDFSTTTVEKNGNYYQSSKLGGLNSKVAGMKSLAEKLGRLAKAGMPGALLQEIAGMGIDGGNQAADSLLGASKQEQSTYVSAWGEFEKYANLAGSNVTLGFYKGGINAAQGVVKGLESQQKNVESSIANLAKAIESTFRSVLGIHSPSTVMAELGGNTAEGLVQGMLAGVTDVQSAASILGDAAVSGAFPPVDEAIRQMPGFTTSTTPEGTDATAPTEGDPMMVGGIPVPDTTPITDAWQAMFDTMLATTIAGWALQVEQQTLAQTTMQTLLAEHQAATLAAYQTHYTGLTTLVQGQYAAMNAAVLAALQLQQSQIATGFTGQHTVMSEILGLMSETLASRWSGMSGTQSGYLSGMQTNASMGFGAIRSGGEQQMSALADSVAREMGTIPPETRSELERTASVLNSFAAAVNKAFGDVGVKLPSVAFADGGVMPGYTPGRDVHQFYSPTAGNLYLSGGEAIMRPEFTRLVGGEQGIKELNQAAMHGDLSQIMHFATGGVIPAIPGVNAFADSGVWRNLWAITKAEFPNARLTSAYRPGSITASGNRSHHSRGNAIDVSPSMDIFNFWRNTYGRNLAELIYSPANGRQIKNGQDYMYTGAVRSMHFNHVHIAAVRALSEAMAGGLPGMGGAMSHPFLDRAGISAGSDLEAAYERAAEKLTRDIYAKHAKLLPDGLAGQFGRGIMSQASEGLVDKAREYGKTTSTAGMTPGDPAVKAAVRKVLEQMGWGEYWPDVDWLVNKESSWNPNAANPHSSARGLFQKMTSLHGPLEDTVEGQARWGLNYIKSTYGNPAKARAFHERNNWYEDGIMSARSGWAVVGENGPELVNLSGGERIHNAAESRKLLAENRTFIPNMQSGPNTADIGKAIAAEIKRGQFTPADLARALDGIPLRLVLDNGREFNAHIASQVGQLARQASRAHG